MDNANIYSSIDQYQADHNASASSAVFTNGCFDILHKGHIACLEASKKLGDFLIIGLNSDSSVKRLKGPHRPINKWEDRAYVLSRLRCVDCVIGFDEETPIDLIKALRPDIITKGGDYKEDEMIGGSFVKSYGGQIVILPYISGYSTTKIIDKNSIK